jgi:hypothetical protein
MLNDNPIPMFHLRRIHVLLMSILSSNTHTILKIRRYQRWVETSCGIFDRGFLFLICYPVWYLRLFYFTDNEQKNSLLLHVEISEGRGLLL